MLVRWRYGAWGGKNIHLNSITWTPCHRPTQTQHKCKQVSSTLKGLSWMGCCWEMSADHLRKVKGHLCFLLLGCLGGSPCGSWNMSMNIGSNLRKITVDTSKFLSRRLMRFRKSWDRLDISDHFFILLKNWIKLRSKKKNICACLVLYYKNVYDLNWTCKWVVDVTWKKSCNVVDLVTKICFSSWASNEAKYSFNHFMRSLYELVTKIAMTYVLTANNE